MTRTSRQCRQVGESQHGCDPSSVLQAREPGWRATPPKWLPTWRPLGVVKSSVGQRHGANVLAKGGRPLSNVRCPNPEGFGGQVVNLALARLD